MRFPKIPQQNEKGFAIAKDNFIASKSATTQTTTVLKYVNNAITDCNYFGDRHEYLSNEPGSAIYIVEDIYWSLIPSEYTYYDVITFEREDYISSYTFRKLDNIIEPHTSLITSVPSFYARLAVGEVMKITMTWNNSNAARYVPIKMQEGELYEMHLVNRLTGGSIGYNVVFYA